MGGRFLCHKMVAQNIEYAQFDAQIGAGIGCGNSILHLGNHAAVITILVAKIARTNLVELHQVVGSVEGKIRGGVDVR